MKRISVLIAAVLFLGACNSTPMSDEESKRKELQQYKQQVNELQEKIEVLESELAGVKKKKQ
jgi:cell division protein FtsB